MAKRIKRIQQIIGVVISQVVNTPFIAGAALTVLLFSTRPDVPQRILGWGVSLVFLTIVPALSLLFYIPRRNEPWASTESASG
jgi:cyanate permease